MNKTITIYELLGLVKDGKAPKKIIYNEETLIIDEYLRICEKEGRPCVWEIDNDFLNDIVEIIEDNDKIEKLDDRYYDEINKCFGGRQMLGETVLVDKINELIDHINKIEEKLDER